MLKVLNNTAMTLEDLQQICNSLNGVTTDIKWENHLCFNIGEKMFLILSLDNIPTTASFKTNAESFDEITSQNGFKAAPYLGRYKWVALDDINRLTLSQWDTHIKTAYKLIASKLPKKTRVELKLEF